MKEFSWDISGIQLIPGTEGAFEITVDGDLIYSKKQTDEFPSNELIARLIRDRK